MFIMETYLLFKICRCAAASEPDNFCTGDQLASSRAACLQKFSTPCPQACASTIAFTDIVEVR